MKTLLENIEKEEDNFFLYERRKELVEMCAPTID